MKWLKKLSSTLKELKLGNKMRPNWDEYFMAMAILASTRASCKHVRAGSIIVLDKRIIGTGYNGAPVGVKDNCLDVDCNKENKGMKYREAFNVGKCIGVHAEMNALANLSREIHKGATLYVTIFPCPTCAKNLLAYNIKKVVYKREYDHEESELAMALFKEAGVEIEKLDLGPDKLKKILFGQDNVDFDVFSEEEKSN
jgi:dCMP deaminase